MPLDKKDTVKFLKSFAYGSRGYEKLKKDLQTRCTVCLPLQKHADKFKNLNSSSYSTDTSVVKFCEGLFGSFHVMLLTDRQTDRQTDTHIPDEAHWRR